MKRIRNGEMVNAIIAINKMGNRLLPGVLSHALTWNLKELMGAYGVYDPELKKLEEKGIDTKDSNSPEVRDLLNIEVDLNIVSVPYSITQRDDVMITMAELVVLDFMFEKEGGLNGQSHDNN